MATVGIDNLKSGLFRGIAGLRRLLSDPDPEVLNQQLEDTRAMLPILAGFHLLAVLAFCDFAYASVPRSLLVPWAAIGILVAAGMLLSHAAIGWAKLRFTQTFRRLLLPGPIKGLAFTLFWVWASVGNIKALPESDYDIASMIALATLFVGALVTIRLPATAVQGVIGMVAIAMFRDVSAREAYFAMPYVFGAVSMVCFSTIVFMLGYGLRHRAQLEKNERRDAELIRMLLNDVGGENGDLFWETNSEGQLVHSSQRLRDILEKDGEPDTPTCFDGRFFGKFAPHLMQRIAALEILRNENLQITQDGATSHWHVSARPIIESDGRFIGYRGVARDVTAQHLQESRLAQARDVAQQAADTKSQFLAVISHELRTPINAIVGFSEVLSAGQGEHLSVSARREYLGTILESAKHLQGLINEILESTRIERGSIRLDEQPNDAAELVEVVARIVRDQATQSKISVVARVIDDVEVTGDLTRLKQVILNILSNAIKFSPEGGVVNVDMLRIANGDLVITVRDAGIGISDADAERVFEPFVQAEAGSNRRFGGMGLGLSIARRIARLHGGELTLKGLKGGGTEARFTLPAARVRWPKVKAKSDGATVAA